MKKETHARQDALVHGAEERRPRVEVQGGARAHDVHHQVRQLLVVVHSGLRLQMAPSDQLADTSSHLLVSSFTDGFASHQANLETKPTLSGLLGGEKRGAFRKLALAARQGLASCGIWEH